MYPSSRRSSRRPSQVVGLASSQGFTRQLARGFTLVEMIMVLSLVSILTVIAAPRMDLAGATTSVSARQQLVAALRLAQKMSISHERLVCATFSEGSLALTMATFNPASACVGAAVATHNGGNNHLSGAPVLTLSTAPSATLHFQPSGQVTTDVAGLNPANFTISLKASEEQAEVISVTGRTGSMR